MLVQSLWSSLSLVCIDSFEISVYTFSLFSVLYTFLFLPGPVQGMSTCSVKGEARARVGQGKSELHFLPQQGRRPADGTCQTLKGCSQKRNAFFKGMKKILHFRLKPSQVKCTRGCCLESVFLWTSTFWSPAWFDQSSGYHSDYRNTQSRLHRKQKIPGGLHNTIYILQ